MMTQIVRTIIAVMAICLNATSLHAQEPYFALLVEPDGAVSIKNVSDREFLVSSYAIFSKSRTMNEAGWYPIGKQFLDDPNRIVSLLGADFLQGNIVFFASSSPTLQSFIEFGGPPSMQWDAGLSIPIGKPFGENITDIRSRVESGDYTWNWEPVFLIGVSQRPIWFVPEPSAFVLALAAGGLIYVTRRVSS